ncbi:unnamed protein product [Lactuca virosa]|uniref:N-acetyltransferase domain-containing protein n=1 Tax=Lactuca virosa TaxID=75947 RepID=A0AAU9ME42_9ASTR|nr:unnamed protein product [Lactuca virosa]
MGEHHNTFRGYIVMFVVLKPYRHRGIATELVTGSIKKRGYKFVILKPVIMTKFDIMEVIRKEFMIAGLKGIKLCYSHASHSDRIRYRGSYSKRIYDCGHEGGGILLQLSIPGLR